MDLVRGTKRKQKAAQMFKAIISGYESDDEYVGDDEDVGDDRDLDMESAIARAKLAEELATQAKKEAEEAKATARLLEIKLAESQRNYIQALKGQATATSTLAEVRTELANARQDTLNSYARKHFMKNPPDSTSNVEARITGDSSGGTTLSPGSSSE